MARFYPSATVWVTLTLAPCFGPDQVFAASPAGATDAPETTVPQGNDPALFLGVSSRLLAARQG